jgi:transposase
MVAIPTLGAEDARRPNRERENLVGERTRIVNRMKACLARLGIRNFKSTLRKASKLLETLCTPEEMPLPPNTLAELRRDMARLCFITDQIKEIERTRLHRLQQSPEKGPIRWYACWPELLASALRQQTCSCRKFCRATCEIGERSRVMQV